jgi:transposase
MRRTAILEGVRMMRFLDVFGRCERRELSRLEAAELLGVNERTLRRWCRRFEAEGEAGLHDRRLAKASGKRVPVDVAMRVEQLYRQRYDGFTVKHFHEHLVRDHGFRWGYTWTKTFLHRRGLIEPAPRRGAHRRKRPRRPMTGMMLHQDASPHRWIPALEASFDLVITLDDATGEIYAAFLVAEEGTASTFQALLAVFGRHGLPCSLYTDRGSHYFITPKAGGKPDPNVKTQVGRALAQLGIEHIPAYSPEARGRCERAFRTLQDRLPKELALAGITSVEEANRFLREVYLAAHNARFAVAAEQPGSAFVAVDPTILADILCIQEERQVGNDNTVSYNRRRLQIPPSPIRPHYVRAKVRVHHYPDGAFAVFHGPRCLARYAADGSLQEQTHGRCHALRPSSPVDKAPALPTGATTTEAVNQCAT